MYKVNMVCATSMSHLWWLALSLLLMLLCSCMYIAVWYTHTYALCWQLLLISLCWLHRSYALSHCTTCVITCCWQIKCQQWNIRLNKKLHSLAKMARRGSTTSTCCDQDEHMSLYHNVTAAHTMVAFCGTYLVWAVDARPLMTLIGKRWSGRISSKAPPVWDQVSTAMHYVQYTTYDDEPW
jgi:hypothetical protein